MLFILNVYNSIGYSVKLKFILEVVFLMIDKFNFNFGFLFMNMILGDDEV